MLSMTNRFARVIDRSRILSGELRTAHGLARERALAQVAILSHRAILVRRAILLAAVSVLLAAVLIIVLFLTALLKMEAAWAVGALFMGCMACLNASLVCFIRD